MFDVTTIATEKRCTSCEAVLPLTSFYVKERIAKYRGVAGYSATCKQCVSKRNAERGRRGTWLKSLYGMTIEQWNEMFSAQRGCCAICSRHQTEVPKQRLQVDHNHETSKVRGLLCSDCNLAIGLFRDDTHSLSKAIQYLDERAG